MIDVPPYPPIEACVRAGSAEAGRVTTRLTFSGEPDQVGAVLEKVRDEPRLRVDADTEENGIRFVRVSGTGDIPYRVIGSMIFEAQRRRLEVGGGSFPPICSPDEPE